MLTCAATIVTGARRLGLKPRAGVHTGEVVASSTVKDFVAGSDVRFVEHGEHELAVLPGPWRLYRVAL